MQIRDVMTRDVRIETPEDTIQHAAARMAELDTGILPVAEGDKLVGMITDRDIACRAVANGFDPKATTVRQVMSSDVKYCYDDEDINHIAANMAELQVRRLPVVNREKRLVGIVSLGDIATQAKSPKVSGDALRRISTPGGQHSQSAH